MAFSDRKRRSIIADWKTGEYSMGQLAKKHKINKSTVSRLCNGVQRGENAHIVEAFATVEAIKIAKVGNGNATEIAAAEREARRKVQLQRMNETLIDQNRELLLKAQTEISKQLNGGIDDPKDIKPITGAIKDIESVANPKPDVAIQNNISSAPQQIQVVFVDSE